MWRLMGAALLLGSGLWIGLKAAGELRRRVRALDVWIAALTRMENELDFRLPDLPELLEIMADGAETPAREVFRTVRARLDNLGALPFARLWREGLTEAPGGLSGGDLDTLSRLGGTLGRYAWEDQRRVIGLVRKELETGREEARQASDRKGKARVALGLTAVCFLIILLI